MGTTVLEAGVPLQYGLHAYAHCLRDVPGGVALLVIEDEKDGARAMRVPMAGVRYTMSAVVLDSGRVMLNGKELGLRRGDALPAMVGVRVGRRSCGSGLGRLRFWRFQGRGIGRVGDSRRSRDKEVSADFTPAKESRESRTRQIRSRCSCYRLAVHSAKH